jgi:hypothetical protein
MDIMNIFIEIMPSSPDRAGRPSLCPFGSWHVWKAIKL